MGKEKDTKKTEQIAVPLKWNVPDDIITRVATNIVIQTLEDGIKISFFEAKPEIVIDPNTKAPTEVRADCVASIMVTSGRFAKFTKLMQQQIELSKT